MPAVSAPYDILFIYYFLFYVCLHVHVAETIHFAHIYLYLYIYTFNKPSNVFGDNKFTLYFFCRGATITTTQKKKYIFGIAHGNGIQLK